MPAAANPNVITTESRILLSQAKPGFVLSRTVESPTRARLCPAGTTLSDELIRRLSARGIKRIWVAGTPLPGAASEPWTLTVERLRERFSRVRQEPYLMAIERAVETALAKHQR
jgi:hypothetical protein